MTNNDILAGILTRGLFDPGKGFSYWSIDAPTRPHCLTIDGRIELTDEELDAINAADPTPEHLR